VHRRDILLAAAAAAVAPITSVSEAKAAAQSSTSKKIDAHTHFTPMKFLDFAEKTEGRPFALSGLLRSKPPIHEVEPRIELMDRNGIDMHVLVPVPWIESFPKIYADAELATQAAKMMNDELAAVVASHPSRFKGVAILPSVDPDAMVAELHRAVTELGFVGAYAAVGPTAKRMDHPNYDPLYKALVDLDATLWLHPSRPPIIPDYLDEKFSQYYEWQLVGWPYDTTSAMFRIVFSGVFDRYPSIRIVTHHHGAFVPLLAPRINNVSTLLEAAGPLPTKIAKPYIDHFKKFHCDTAASGFAPKALELAVDFFGPERVLFGSDAPLDMQNGQVFTTETLQSIEAMQISDDTRVALFSGNAKRIFRLT